MTYWILYISTEPFLIRVIYDTHIKLYQLQNKYKQNLERLGHVKKQHTAQRNRIQKVCRYSL